MANITLMGASYADVPAVSLPATGGGTAMFMDTSDADATASDILSGKTAYVNGQKIVGTGSGGGGLVHVQSLTKQTVKLSDTDFATWTPSTTAKVILATDTAGTFTATDVADNDYFVRCRLMFNPVYVEGTATSKGRVGKMVGENWYNINRRANSNTNFNSSTRNTNVAESVTNYCALQYYNSGWVMVYSTSYGVYPSNSAPTFSSTSSASPTVTVKRPIINARCNATYFATGMANALDQDESTLVFVFDIYKRTGGYDRRSIQLSMMDMWNNGL